MGPRPPPHFLYNTAEYLTEITVHFISSKHFSMLPFQMSFAICLLETLCSRLHYYSVFFIFPCKGIATTCLCHSSWEVYISLPYWYCTWPCSLLWQMWQICQEEAFNLIVYLCFSALCHERTYVREESLGLGPGMWSRSKLTTGRKATADNPKPPTCELSKKKYL